MRKGDFMTFLEKWRTGFAASGTTVTAVPDPAVA
jgi:hypothetical protein